MMRKLLAASLTTFACYSVADTVSFTDLDWDRMIQDQGIIHVPIKELNKGPIWYQEYYQKVLQPTRLNRNTKVVWINLNPLIRKDNRDSYYEFLNTYNVSDAKTNLFPEDATLCEPTEKLVTKLERLYPVHKLENSISGYPSVCKLKVIYPKDHYANTGIEYAEQQLIDFLNSNQVVNFNANIVSKINPIIISQPDIISILAKDNILTFDEEKNLYTGKLTEFLYSSLKLAMGTPALFGSISDQQTKSNWQTFINNFTLSTVKQEEPINPDVESSNEPEEPVPTLNKLIEFNVDITQETALQPIEVQAGQTIIQFNINF